MGLLSLDVMKMATRRMEYSAERQKLVAQNIANADSPDYKAVDLKPMNFQGELRAVRSNRSDNPAGSMHMTNSGHLQGTASGGLGRFSRDGAAKGWEASISGNGVIIEQEMLKAADIQSQNALAMNVYRKSVGLIKMAIGRG